MPSPARAIPLQAVSCALMCAVTRLHTRTHDGQRLARCAAYTQVPSVFSYRCRDARWQRSRKPQPMACTLITSHFAPMDRGDIDTLAERVRMDHGPAEVRAIWGASARFIRAEGGVMR